MSLPRAFENSSPAVSYYQFYLALVQLLPETCVWACYFPLKTILWLPLATRKLCKCFSKTFFLSFFFVVILGIELWAWCMLNMHCTTELHPQLSAQSCPFYLLSTCSMILCLLGILQKSLIEPHLTFCWCFCLKYFRKYTNALMGKKTGMRAVAWYCWPKLFFGETDMP